MNRKLACCTQKDCGATSRTLGSAATGYEVEMGQKEQCQGIILLERWQMAGVAHGRADSRSNEGPTAEAKGVGTAALIIRELFLFSQPTMSGSSCSLVLTSYAPLAGHGPLCSLEQRASALVETPQETDPGKR